MDMSGFERDPKKRRVKPGPSQHSLLDFDDLGESSDDSDFRIEDHHEESDDDSIDSDGGRDDADDDDDSDDDGDEEEDDLQSNGLALVPAKAKNLSVTDLLKEHMKIPYDGQESLKVFICCSCLGDRSDDLNEIVECDGCGVTVHEGCYGVSDTASVSSTISSCSTAPWFCEACRAGVMNPSCELCPNSGGIFKETDVGKWVHLVCALYVPGVAFGEVDKLSSVTLFEMPYNKWGAKTCSLCEDQRFSRTGVCIECDAGMCRTFFHVTCAQREGLLSETHSEEVDQADPFYAHCKMHTDKALMRRRRRNWMALQLRTHQRQMEYAQIGHNLTPEQLRIKRKLAKYRQKYLAHKGTRITPWVPTQKMPRLLTTSASAVRKLNQKTELMGIDTQALELEEAQVASLVDVRKKWHIAPAFNVEYVGYYLDRNERMLTMKKRLEELVGVNRRLQNEQQELRVKYDKLLTENTDLSCLIATEKQVVLKYHSIISYLAPSKRFPLIDQLCKPLARQVTVTHKISSLEAKGGKAGQMSLNECGICRQTIDQHLLAKCDACHLFYHLGCLSPPLTRMPKKTKLMGWQCSECDKDTSGSEIECLDTEAPRKLRHKENEKLDESFPKLTIKSLEPHMYSLENAELANAVEQVPDSDIKPFVDETVVPTKQGKKRRREKHRRYSPSPIKEHKRKRKRKSFHGDRTPEEQDHPRIKIKIKPIPRPVGDRSPYGPQMFVATSTTETVNMSPELFVAQSSSGNGRVSSGFKPIKDADVMTMCDVCITPGTNQNLVRCDECVKCFHFTCLDPPVKKSPKRRGYSWHCADCDPTETESE